MKGVEEQGQRARKALTACGIPVSDLREQWKSQLTSELSAKARTFFFTLSRGYTYLVILEAPRRLKKELDTILTLQADIEVVMGSIQSAQMTLSKSVNSSTSSLHLLSSLRTEQEHFTEKLEEIYSSLNIPDSFPELRDVNFEFVHVLLMARELKINIRKRAVGSFFEWDKIDRAVGGREESLGVS